MYNQLLSGIIILIVATWKISAGAGLSKQGYNLKTFPVSASTSGDGEPVQEGSGLNFGRRSSTTETFKIKRLSRGAFYMHRESRKRRDQ